MCKKLKNGVLKSQNQTLIVLENHHPSVVAVDASGNAFGGGHFGA
jgi:hypothetical protein